MNSAVKFFSLRCLALLCAVTAALLLPTGCGTSSAAGNITLSGTLQTSSRGRAVLAGYKLYCVTFTTPAVSGTATADSSGAFTLTLAALNQPFGCFVLNTSDVQVAAVFFNSSTDSATGQTIAFSGDTALGAITIDEDGGTANVTVTASLSTTPTGLACPLGSWTGNIGVNSNCAGQTVAGSIWIGVNAAGAYTINQTYNPTEINNHATCGLHSFPATASTIAFASNVLTYHFAGGSNDNIDVAATANTACDQLSVVITQTGCDSCGDPANPVTNCIKADKGTGRVTCVSSAHVFTKN